MSLFNRKFADHSRTPESWEKHNEKISKCGQYYASYYHVVEGGIFEDLAVFPVRCKSNYCPTCRKSNISKLRNMMYNSIVDLHETWRFLTLTYDPKKIPIVDQYKDVGKMWDRFVKRLNRIVDNPKWIRSVELQRSGNIHLHSIINKWIAVDDYIKHWSDLGGGAVTITMKPRCKDHRKEFCAVCYPAQWLHKYPCERHGLKNCFVCFPYLKPCPDHKKEICGVCFPSNSFDASRYAADYLTTELIKSKNHQDVYKTGLNWWLARRRSIATSRNIKLKKETPGHYSFNRLIGDYSELKIYLESYRADNYKAVKQIGNSYSIYDVV